MLVILDEWFQAYSGFYDTRVFSRDTWGESWYGPQVDHRIPWYWRPC